MRLPSEEEWNAWWQEPSGDALRAMLRLAIAAEKDRWAGGEFLDVSQFATAINGARAIGTCDMASRILEIDFQQVIGELSEK